ARGDPPLPHRGRPPSAGGHRPHHRRRGPGNRACTVGVLVLGAAAGLVLARHGPASPRLRQAYGVGGGESALVLSAHFAGAMTGIAWWGLERRLAPGTWLRAPTALRAAGAGGSAVGAAGARCAPGPGVGPLPPCCAPARPGSPSPRPGRSSWRRRSGSGSASGWS